MTRKRRIERIVDFSQMSTEAVLGELGQRIRRARLNANWTQAELAERAGISRRSLQKAEEGEVTTVETLVNILRGLSQLGQLDQFLPEPPWSPVQMAKLQGEKRQRASRKRTAKPAPSAWKWKE